MKNLLLFIFIPSYIFSQEPNIITTFEFGTKPLKINELDVTLEYIDESPSPDYFATNFSLEQSESVNYFSIGFMQDNFKEKLRPLNPNFAYFFGSYTPEGSVIIKVRFSASRF